MAFKNEAEGYNFFAGMQATNASAFTSLNFFATKNAKHTQT